MPLGIFFEKSIFQKLWIFEVWFLGFFCIFAKAPDEDRLHDASRRLEQRAEQTQGDGEDEEEPC